MARTRLTKRTISALRSRTREFIAWDCDLVGFGVRVRPSGSKSFVVQYRAGTGRNSPVRKLTLGAIKKLTTDEARALAKKALGSVAHGHDPARQKSDAQKTIKVSELVDLFLTQHVEAKRRASTAVLYRDILKRIVTPAIGDLKADKVTRSDIARLHLSMKTTPYQANRTVAVVGSMFAFAGKRGLVPDSANPSRGIERYREAGRERFLSSAELVRLGAAIRHAETKGVDWIVDPRTPQSKHLQKSNRRTVIGPHAAAAIRLLLFTGCRLREILHLKWEHIDFERGLLFLPESKTGKKTVVLNAPSLEVLAQLERVGAFVIAGDDPSSPRSDLKRPWSLVIREAQLSGLRIHDLRHSFASFGAGAGLGLPIVGKLLGHTNAVTTARYAHLDADPLRAASNRIGATIAAAISGTASKNETLVPLRKRR